jgi:NAD(P)-dependent dehydrogenase (short-subunit alcohol dehydrogenase family)
MNDEKALMSRVALVTGGGQPLADAVARAFLREGARVALACLPGQSAAVRAAFTDEAPALVCECDPADPEAVRATVRQVVQDLGGLHILANLATARSDGAVPTLSSHDWTRVLDVELSGTLYFCREAVRPMLRQRGGHIVNLTDVAGLRGEARAANHATASGGVAALTRALAAELGPMGIHVNALVVSRMAHEEGQLDETTRARLRRHTAFGRLGTVEEAAGVALFLASGAATFTTGHLLQVNGGLYS